MLIDALPMRDCNYTFDKYNKEVNDAFVIDSIDRALQLTTVNNYWYNTTLLPSAIVNNKLGIVKMLLNNCEKIDYLIYKVRFEKCSVEMLNLIYSICPNTLFDSIKKQKIDIVITKWILKKYNKYCQGMEEVFNCTTNMELIKEFPIVGDHMMELYLTKQNYPRMCNLNNNYGINFPEIAFRTFVNQNEIVMVNFMVEHMTINPAEEINKYGKYDYNKRTAQIIKCVNEVYHEYECNDIWQLSNYYDYQDINRAIALGLTINISIKSVILREDIKIFKCLCDNDKISINNIDTYFDCMEEAKVDEIIDIESWEELHDILCAYLKRMRL
jgi:hypothetical protein